MPYTTHGVGHRLTDTSEYAAQDAQGRAPFWRLKVMEDLNMHGPSTADEIAARLKASILTIRPRVTELRNLRRIYDTGARRRNASGKTAAVWAINPQGEN